MSEELDNNEEEFVIPEEEDPDPAEEERFHQETDEEQNVNFIEVSKTELVKIIRIYPLSESDDILPGIALYTSIRMELKGGIFLYKYDDGYLLYRWMLSDTHPGPGVFSRRSYRDAQNCLDDLYEYMSFDNNTKIYVAIREEYL